MRKIALLLVLLLALAVRLYRLDGQSLWYDEGTSIALAMRDIPTIIQSAAADIHPPLYYILLHAWVRLFGTSEIAVRLLSLLAGVAVVYLTYLLGCGFFGQRAGLLAALLGALSPFLVYYSQEARMYMPATLLAALSVYLLARALSPPSPSCVRLIVTHISQRFKTAPVKPAAERRPAPTSGYPHRQTSGRYHWPTTCDLGHLRQMRVMLSRVLGGGRAQVEAVSPPRERGGGGGGTGHPALYLSYVLVTLAALYTHYFAATVVLAQDVAIAVLLVVALRQGRAGAAYWLRVCVPLVAAQAAVGLLYLPWLPAMLSQFSNWPAISEFYNLFELMARLFPIFSLGLSVETGEVLLPLCVFTAVMVIGILPSPRPSPNQGEGAGSLPSLEGGRAEGAGRVLGKRPAPSPYQGEGWGEGRTLIALSWLLVPVLVMFILSLRRPLYNPKFLLVAVPAFYLLLGRGLHRLASLRFAWGKAAAAITLLILAGSSLYSLHNYYHDPHDARDDYRGLVRTITTAQRSGDAIVLNAPGQIDIFGYYYKGSLPIYPLPRQRPPDEQATADELAHLAAAYQRLWLVYYGDQQADPRRVIESWLDARAFKASDRWFGDARLALYVIAGTDKGRVALNARFGPHITLLGYRLGAERVTAGDIVPLSLYWQAENALTDRYTVFVHVINRHDTLWGQRDSEPSGGLRPTTTWQQGETIQDNYGLPVLPGTPPGDYQIEIGMYRPDSGQRLPITANDGSPLGDRVLLGLLQVERPAVPPSPDMLGMQRQSRATLDGLRLLGYNLARLGQEPGAPEFAGSDVLHLSLFWQAEAAPLRDLVISVQVLDAGGQPVRQRQSRPADGDYPTTLWAQSEIVRDQHRLPLSRLAAGQYRLIIVVQDASGRSMGQVELGSITVK